MARLTAEGNLREWLFPRDFSENEVVLNGFWGFRPRQGSVARVAAQSSASFVPRARYADY
jgi:hypothetical protein